MRSARLRVGPRLITVTLTCGRGSAEAELNALPELGEDAALLNGVRVTPSLRGAGYGAMALRAALAYADQRQLRIYTYAKPFGVRGLTVAQLTEWYCRYGFKYAQLRSPTEDVDWLIRDPAPKFSGGASAGS